MMHKAPNYRPIVAATRVLQVLACVSAEGPVRLVEVNRRTGLSPATTLRMLETLENSGYVRRLPGPRYVVTANTLDLSSGFNLGDEVAAVAGPLLTALQSSLGWPSDVAVFDGGAMLVVATSRSDDPFFSNRRPGYRAPVMETSLGRAFLGWSERALRERIVAQCADRKEARKIVRQVGAQGHGVMAEHYSASEYSGAVSALGLPILVDGRPIAAINIMFLKNVISHDEAVMKLLEPLRSTAAEIARAFAAKLTDTADLASNQGRANK